MLHLLSEVSSLAREDEGAQIIEYALIVAVVALSLVIALNAITSNSGGFTQLITRLVACLTTSTCT